MSATKYLAAAGLAILVAGCGDHHSAATVSPDTLVATTTQAQAAGDKPMTFYAQQWVTLVAGSNAAAVPFKKLLDDPSSTITQMQPSATAWATATQAAVSAILRAQWPANVLPDIKAWVSTVVPVISDMRDLADNDGTLAADFVKATSATQIVRADVGLPAPTAS